MKKFPDYYEILNIPSYASQDDIVLAFNEKIEPFRWILSTSNQVHQEQMVLFNKAFEVLSNPKSRIEYDTFWRVVHEKRFNFVSSSKKPLISRFYADLDENNPEGDIKISWKTDGGDQVILKPFGPVASEGEMNLEKALFLSSKNQIELIVYNTINGESKSGILIFRGLNLGSK